MNKLPLLQGGCTEGILRCAWGGAWRRKAEVEVWCYKLSESNLLVVLEIYYSLTLCNFWSCYNQCQTQYYKRKQSLISTEDSLSQDCSDGWSVGSARFVWLNLKENLHWRKGVRHVRSFGFWTRCCAIVARFLSTIFYARSGDRLCNNLLDYGLLQVYLGMILSVQQLTSLFVLPSLSVLKNPYVAT